MVMDTGFNSEANRRALQGGGDAAYQGSDIIGEKMRLGEMDPQGGVISPGRYKALAGGLSFNDGDRSHNGSVTSRRFVIVHDAEQASGTWPREATSSGGGVRAARA